MNAILKNNQVLPCQIKFGQVIVNNQVVPTDSVKRIDYSSNVSYGELVKFRVGKKDFNFGIVKSIGKNKLLLKVYRNNNFEFVTILTKDLL